MPHRKDDQLKPQAYQTYREMYLNGGVVIKPATDVQSVRIIVSTNKQKFETNVEALDGAEEMAEMQGPLDDAWALIASETEAERIECNAEKIHVEEDDLDIPELDPLKRKERQGNDIEIRQSMYSTDQIQPRKQYCTMFDNGA